MKWSFGTNIYLVIGQDLDQSELAPGPEEPGEAGQAVQVVGDGGQAQAPGEDAGEAWGRVAGEPQPLPVLDTDPASGTWHDMVIS